MHGDCDGEQGGQANGIEARRPNAEEQYSDSNGGGEPATPGIGCRQEVAACSHCGEDNRGQGDPPSRSKRKMLMERGRDATEEYCGCGQKRGGDIGSAPVSAPSHLAM